MRRRVRPLPQEATGPTWLADSSFVERDLRVVTVVVVHLFVDEHGQYAPRVHSIVGDAAGIVIVEGPVPGVVALDDDVRGLSRPEGNRVDLEWTREHVAVLRHLPELMAVEMHVVHQAAPVHES